MERTAGLQKFIDDVSKDMFGRTQTDSLQKQICVSCGSPAVEFRDRLSAKEYGISGLCQDCQDAVFD